MENHNNRGNRLAWKALIPLAGLGALLMWGQTASTPMSQVVSGRAPLPQQSNVRSIVPTENGIWFLAQDPAPVNPEWAVYFWSDAGVQHVPVDCREMSTGVPQLVPDATGSPWLLTSCGVFHHNGSAFQRHAEFDALHAKGLEGGAFPWLISAGNQIVYLPGWDAAGAQVRQAPGQITHWSADSMGSLYFSVQGADGDRLFVTSPYSLAVQEIAAPAGKALQNIAAMYAGSWSDLWISQGNGQLLRYFGNAWVSYANTVAALRLMGEDSDGNLYLVPEAAGAATDAAYLMIPRGLRLQSQGAPEHFRLDKIRGRIQSVASDATGGTWMGMEGGAFRIRGGGASPGPRLRSERDSRSHCRRRWLPRQFRLAANSVPSFPWRQILVVQRCSRAGGKPGQFHYGRRLGERVLHDGLSQCRFLGRRCGG